MKSLVTRLMLIALLCYQCRGQSPERHLAYAVDASIAKMEALSQRFEEMGNHLNTKVEEMGTQMNIKFKEMGNQLNTTVEEMGNQLNTKVEETGTQMNIKFEELHERMTTMEELHERMTTMEDIQRLEQSIQKCSSRKQVSDFQSLFTDECAEGSHNCSALASCENTLLHYQCNCLPGYEGDGFTCEDVDECSTASANICHSQSTCTNTVGHYTCSCIPGFSGDGFNCEDVCETPAKSIESLGCVIPVNIKMSWEDAKENCQTKGGRLLEGITTQSELDQLKQHFDSILDYGNYVWVGMQRGQWIVTGNAIGSSSPLWGSKEQDSGDDCGTVVLYEPKSYIGDFTCPSKRPSLCQK